MLMGVGWMEGWMDGWVKRKYDSMCWMGWMNRWMEEWLAWMDE